ncbi:MAG: lamin tail domain-containing protein, partial [Planctomycetes bacterium]|nr:lamin tail domain-containing protein [Planctomycetota bacterium]
MFDPQRAILAVCFVFALMAGASICSAQVPEVLYYKLNETTGTTTANDASPGQGANPATFNPAPTWVTTGQPLGASAKSGLAVITSGTSLSTTASFTIEFWMQGTSGTFGYLCGDPGAGNVRIFAAGAAGTNNITLRGGGFSNLDLANANDGNWNHVAFVYDSVAQTMTAYLNGTQAGQNTAQTGTGTGSGFFVGNNQAGTGSGFAGGMDEFRLWSTPRSAGDIAANFNSEISLTDPTATPTSGSAFTGSTGAGFDASVDAGTALANFSLDCDDANTANIDATITTSGAAPGVTQPTDVTAGAVVFTLVWTGTPSTPGMYTYTVTLDDGSAQTIFDVRITVTSPAPLLSAPYAPPPSSAIQITEIALDPGTSGDEYCEIQNVSSAAVTLTNWTITVWDGSTTPDFTNTINTVTLQPGDTYIFCDNGSATFPAANQGFSANLLWDGTNCGAMVQDDSGNIVDCVFWGNMNVPTITQPLAIGSEWVG